MSDSKIYMFPESNHSSDAALWANMSRNNDPMTAMLASNGGGFNNMWNNPIWAIVFLAALRNGGIFGGNNNGELPGYDASNQLSAIREQLGTNQNTTLLMDAIKGNNGAIEKLATTLNCDINAIQGAINSVQTSICNLGGRVDMNAMSIINAINAGDTALANQLSECCCNMRDAITRQGYENQIATLNQTNVLQNSLNNVGTSLERGFAATNYETAQQTCSITKAIENSTAQILAGQRAAEMREMQREIQALRDERSAYQLSALTQQQTQNLVNQLRPCPIPAYITCNPFGCQSDNFTLGCGGC